jgi:hypothetical protein
MARSAERVGGEFGVIGQTGSPGALVRKDHGPTPHPPEALALAGEALAALGRDARQIARQMTEAVAAEVEPIASVAHKEAELMPRLVRISELSVLTLVKVTREGRDPTEHELAFIHDLAIRRAADAFPLEALIHGLRVGQRVIWERVIGYVADAPQAARAVIVLTEQMLRYTDRLSTALATTYVTTQQARAADHERRRAELVDEIMSGRFPYRPGTPALVAGFGLDPDEECVVMVAVECDTRAPSDPLVRDAVRAAFERHARRQERAP